MKGMKEFISNQTHLLRESKEGKKSTRTSFLAGYYIIVQRISSQILHLRRFQKQILKEDLPLPGILLLLKLVLEKHLKIASLNESKDRMSEFLSELIDTNPDFFSKFLCSHDVNSSVCFGCFDCKRINKNGKKRDARVFFFEENGERFLYLSQKGSVTHLLFLFIVTNFLTINFFARTLSNSTVNFIGSSNTN